MSDWPNFGGLPPAAEASARTVLIPIPHAPTVSYGKGAERGPEAILRASTQIEERDEETGAHWIEAGAIRTLPPLDLSGLGPGEVAARIRQAFAQHVMRGAFVIGLGGEHSITPGAVLGARDIAGDLAVLQIDAHPDLRPSFEGSPWSHACAMRRVAEAGIPVVAVGVRAIGMDDAAAFEAGLSQPFPMSLLRENTAWVDAVIDALPERVFITLDVDGLDPSVMPATGTPEPGGLLYSEVCALIRRVVERRHVVAADVVELAPIPGLHFADYTAARLVQKLIAYRAHRGAGYGG